MQILRTFLPYKSFWFIIKLFCPAANRIITNIKVLSKGTSMVEIIIIVRIYTTSGYLYLSLSVISLAAKYNQERNAIQPTIPTFRKTSIKPF